MARPDGDETFEGRIPYEQIMLACRYATRPVDEHSLHRGRPPVGRLLELLAFVTDEPAEWAGWVSCARRASRRS